MVLQYIHTFLYVYLVVSCIATCTSATNSNRAFNIALSLDHLLNTVRVLNFVGKIFVLLVGKKIYGELIFVAMAAW